MQVNVRTVMRSINRKQNSQKFSEVCMSITLVGSFISSVLILFFFSGVIMSQQADLRPVWLEDSIKKLESELVDKHGQSQKSRLNRGLKQVAALWRDEDGSQQIFEDFVRTHFAGDQ